MVIDSNTYLSPKNDAQLDPSLHFSRIYSKTPQSPRDLQDSPRYNNYRVNQELHNEYITELNSEQNEINSYLNSNLSPNSHSSSRSFNNYLEKEYIDQPKKNIGLASVQSRNLQYFPSQSPRSSLVSPNQREILNDNNINSQIQGRTSSHSPRVSQIRTEHKYNNINQQKAKNSGYFENKSIIAQQLGRFLIFLQDASKDLLSQNFSSKKEEIEGKTYLIQTINEMANFFISKNVHVDLLINSKGKDPRQAISDIDPEYEDQLENDISPSKYINHSSLNNNNINDYELEERDFDMNEPDLLHKLNEQNNEIYQLQEKIKELNSIIKKQENELLEKSIEAEMNNERFKKDVSYQVSSNHGDLTIFDESYIVPKFVPKKALDFNSNEELDNEKLRKLRERTSNSNVLFEGSLRLNLSPNIKLEPSGTNWKSETKQSTPKSKTKSTIPTPQTITVTLPPPELLPFVNPLNQDY